MPCKSKPKLKANDPAQRFVNLKAAYYQNLADAFERNEIEGLTDETTLGRLAGIHYEIDSHGRMKIESKEDARLRGVRLLDRAEALMLALGKLPQKFEYYSASDPPRGRGTLPHDDDYHPDDYMIGGARKGMWDELAPGSLSRYFRKGTAF